MLITDFPVYNNLIVLQKPEQEYDQCSLLMKCHILIDVDFFFPPIILILIDVEILTCFQYHAYFENRDYL